MINRPLLITALALTLFACGDTDNSEPPAELVDFDASVKLKSLWSNSSGEGVERQYLFLEPLVLSDRVVSAGRDGSVIAVSLANGDTLSKVALKTLLSGGVGGDEQLWLVTSRDGEVIAIDAGNGKPRWKTRVPSEVLSRPVLHNDTVLVRTVDGQVVSLDRNSGKIRWSHKQTMPALTLRGSSEPVVSRNHIYVGLESGRLIAISPNDGEVIWDVALTVPQGRSEIQRLVDIDGHAELYGQTLYAASYQGRIAALDTARGRILWSRPFSSHTGVTLDSKVVYSSDDRSHIWALDRFSGATLWKQEKLQARAVTRPVLWGDYLVVGDFEGYIHVLSRFDGHFVARVRVDDGVLVAPLVINEHLLVTSRDGELRSFSLKELATVSR